MSLKRVRELELPLCSVKRSSLQLTQQIDHTLPEATTENCPNTNTPSPVPPTWLLNDTPPPSPQPVAAAAAACPVVVRPPTPPPLHQRHSRLTVLHSTVAKLGQQRNTSQCRLRHSVLLYNTVRLIERQLNQEGVTLTGALHPHHLPLEQCEEAASPPSPHPPSPHTHTNHPASPIVDVAMDTDDDDDDLVVSCSSSSSRGTVPAIDWGTLLTLGDPHALVDSCTVPGAESSVEDTSNVCTASSSSSPGSWSAITASEVVWRTEDVPEEYSCLMQL